MRFAHMGDCHLGSWAQQELRDLNFQSFRYAIDKCIKEKVDFVLITGDLFDSAYPSIDTLKDSFREFRKLKDANIPVFLIAGSHDYSVSGKTFLEVLEKAGFCKNVAEYEEKNGNIILLPTIHKNVAIYGYPGKKSNLEMQDLEHLKMHDSPGLFKILMLHTAISDAINNPNIPAVDHRKLPKVDYLAMSHLHINYNREGRVYSGPIFPNNITELEELRAGSFYIFSNGSIKREEIKLKDTIVLSLEVKNPQIAADDMLKLIEQQNVKDKILIIKIWGILEQGSTADIDFQKVELELKKKGAYVFLKSTTKLFSSEPEMKMDVLDTSHLESEIIKKFEESNPGKFNQHIPELIKALHLEKLEDERLSLFEDRILIESRKILKI
jgi:DNA repair exonuclease SbcCD nuclease subunit